jgi:hypothetical protein
MNSIIYDIHTDNPSYKDVIKEKIVLNEKGEVDFLKYKPISIPKSIMDVNYVLSGRGLYRAWISNLQKSIRRGLVKDALRSAYECMQFKGLFLSHTINRVCKVIISEDIGPANLVLALKVKDYLLNLSSKTDDEKINECFEIIVDMCHSYKSRIVDHSLHLTRRKNFTNYTDYNLAYTDLIQNIKDRNIYKCIHILFYLTTLKEKDCKATFTRVLDKNIKPSRMGTIVYKIWNNLCDPLFISNIYPDLDSKKLKALVELNTAIFQIWYNNSSDEKILNFIHAISNVLLAKEIFNFEEDEKSKEVKEVEVKKYPTIEEVSKYDDIWIMSASYDKHTRKWLSSERNSIQFFLKYGAKLNKLHPNLKYIDQQMYNSILEYSL